jgi:ubiquinol oxidase
MGKTEHEALVEKLKDSVALAAYLKDADGYRPSTVARFLGGTLVWIGNLVYGARPSYSKFKAVEVIARIPYQSWESVAYTMLTAFYSDEERAVRLSSILPFARHAQDNETMHVVVISQLCKKHGGQDFIRHTLIPLLFSFFYFWSIWWVSLFSRKVAFEINYLFESHAYEQYSLFLETHADALKSTPVSSSFLTFYGRSAANEYELFLSICIDEAIHRNESFEHATL